MSSNDLAAQVAAVNKELQNIDDQIVFEQNQITILSKQQEDLELKIKSEKSKNGELIEKLAEEQMKANDQKILSDLQSVQIQNMQKEIEFEKNKILGIRDAKKQMVDNFVNQNKKQLKRCSMERWQNYKLKIIKREAELDEKQEEILERTDEQKQLNQCAKQNIEHAEWQVMELQDELKELAQKLLEQTQEQITLQQELQKLQYQKQDQQQKEQEEKILVEQEIDALHEEMAIQEVEITQLESQRWQQELQNQELKREIETVNKKIQAIQAQRRVQANQKQNKQAANQSSFIPPTPKFTAPCYKQHNPLPNLQIQQLQVPKINNISNNNQLQDLHSFQQQQKANNQNINSKSIDCGRQVLRQNQNASNLYSCPQKNNQSGYNISGQQFVGAQLTGGGAVQGALPEIKQENHVQQNKLKRKSGPKTTNRKKMQQKVLKLTNPSRTTKKQTEEIQDAEDNNQKCDLFGGLL